jgi:hypothetical protein
VGGLADSGTSAVTKEPYHCRWYEMALCTRRVLPYQKRDGDCQRGPRALSGRGPGCCCHRWPRAGARAVSGHWQDGRWGLPRMAPGILRGRSTRRCQRGPGVVAPGRRALAESTPFIVRGCPGHCQTGARGTVREDPWHCQRGARGIVRDAPGHCQRGPRALSERPPGIVREGPGHCQRWP